MVDISAIGGTTAASIGTPSRRWRLLSEAWSYGQCKAGVGLLLLLLLAALFWPLLSPYAATKMAVADRFLPPAILSGTRWDHLLGTDQLGRDLFVRSLVGLQNALLIGISTVMLMFIIGSVVGIVAGYFGGAIDMMLMRITDAQLSIPLIILAITILTVSRPTPVGVIVVLALSGWPAYARVTRSVTLAERRKEYVRGVRILGASHLRIMLLMIAPNILPPAAVVAVLDIARMMIYEALLGFIGIGIQPPTPTFGNIIADGKKYLINAWWIATMPGVFLFLSLFCINLIGSSLERARNRIWKGIV